MELTKHFRIRPERQPCSICKMDNFVNNIVTNQIHNIQVRVRFRCIIQLIRNDPQIFYLRIKLFEGKSCDFTIQVNFFALTIYLNYL